MSEQLKGDFEITEELLRLHLADGRRFTLTIYKRKLIIDDTSWVDYYKEGSGTLTREAILSTHPSNLDMDVSLLRNIYRFMDNTPMPMPGKHNKA